MVRLREIPRAAAFAWSPGSGLPLIATGTRAGAVDADFTTETQLELWDLGLGDVESGGELKPAASIDTDARFYDIAWGKSKDDHSLGIVAGALENGSLDLWDAKALLDGDSKSFMSRTSKHSGAIKSLQFNPFRSELLATAGAKGELFISDLNNVANPFRLGTSAARADDFESVDWNKKVPHILATGSSGGFVTVWDVKAKKESLTLNNLGRKAVSAVAWDPQNSTKLMTAISDDTTPLILMWDLRNSNAPERTLKAHEQGVLSLAWCPQDSDLLLSCGKDNRTICWNPATGQPYGEFPIVTNWTFQTRWNPHNPSLLATASFDGKIGIQTIQNTRPGSDPTSGAKPLNDEDFFNNAQSQPQGAAFSLPKPPKWLERPVGASFGFGGKVVSFGPADRAEGATSRRSKILISHFAIDSGVGTATESFENALREGNFASICESKIASAQTAEDKEEWRVIETLISTNPRKELIEYLGFSSAVDGAADDLSKLKVDEDADEVNALPTQANGTSTAKDNRLSSFFENAGDGESFLSNLSATKGAKTNNPFHIYSETESATDKQITRALLLGQFDKALDVCLKEDRMSDAFMIAICGGQKCIDKAQAAYFKKADKGPNYLRLLASVVGKNLWDFVYNADLANWKEVMATLCTYADQNEFSDLCETLGDRLEEELKHGGGSVDLRKDASFCYLAGSKLEKVVAIWIEELRENEDAGLQSDGADSTFSVHARSLQTFIEKVTVFREVTRYEDRDRTQTSGWKLAPLYDKYTEYADIVAAHGHLQVAEKYLDLLPPQYAAAEVARNRVKQASKRAAPQTTTARQTGTASRNAPRTQSAVGGLPGMQQPPALTPTGSSPYAPTGSAQPSNPYAPSNMAGYQLPGFQGGYQGHPQQQQQQPRPGVAPPPPAIGGYQQGQGIPPPSRNINASPSVPPPSRASNMTNWNDTPMVVKPPTSRRGTPSAGPPPVTAPFPNQQNAFSPPPPAGGPYGLQHRATPPLPPPPKGSGPPARGSSPYGGSPTQQSPQQFDRRTSAATNSYAPPAGQAPAMAPPPATIPRGPSPYNAPPAGPPPSNRYAPSPAAQGYGPLEQQGGGFAPPPPGPARVGPPPNQYGQPPQGSAGPPPRQGAPSPYAPSQQPDQGAGHGPPQAPPQGPRPGPAQAQPASAPPPAAAPPKHPKGDRSHIPDHARGVYEILNADMQRVKSRAPASYKAHITDTEKRLNILFDHLNNEDLLKPNTVESMDELAQALRARDYDAAHAIHLDVLTNQTDQCGQWMAPLLWLISPIIYTSKDMELLSPSIDSAATRGTASPTTPADQARLRKERREAKIKAGGSSRLGRITSMGGRAGEDTAAPAVPKPAVPSPSVEHAADPEEVDISTHFWQPDAGSTPAQQQQRRQQQQQQPMSDPQLPQSMHSFDPSLARMAGPPAADDPMMAMLQQMMGGGAAGGPGGIGGGGPLPPGLAEMMGQASADSATAPTGGNHALTWRITHAMFSLSLAVYALLIAPFPFTGTLSQRRQPPIASAYGSSRDTSVFWYFAAGELFLQSLRFFLMKGGLPPSGMLASVAPFVPLPYRGYLSMLGRYGTIYSTVVADAMVFVFVLGVLSWWRAA
ncbi:MAG: protein transport protein S31 [Thelocarpon impressellum]|nr:MAG: protein transport protein S31 [Thelocarpon impressellum]